MSAATKTLTSGSSEPPDGQWIAADRSIHNASVVAGAGLLLLAALGPFLILVEGLVASGDAAQTARNVIESESLFRFGIASMLLTVALDVVVAWALYRVLRPASTSLSMLAAWFRLAYAAVFMVAVGRLTQLLDLLGAEEYRSTVGTDQLQAQVLVQMEAFTHIWDAALVLVGVHLLVVGYLAYRSGYVPRLLGLLVAVAGLGYAFDSVVAALSARPSFEVATFTFIGELLLALWLLLRGRRLTFQRADAAVAEASTAAAR